MAIVKSLLTIFLLFVISKGVLLQDNETVDDKAVKASEENQFRLSNYVVPIHYDVKLIPHIVDSNFTTNGETSIDIEVREPTNTIALHAVKLAIDESLTKITRKGVDDENSKSEYVPKQHEYNEQTQILTLRFEESLDVGTYTLHINFIGVILPHTEPHGFYKSFYIDDKGNKVWLAVTHFQPTSARQAFPCWDEPAIKATFKFSIKHYPNYTALSNMPSTRSEIDAADGKLWTYFETTPIMSTNLLGFVIADYDYVSNLDGTIKIWGPRHLLSHAAYSLDIIEKATQELEKFINSTYRVPKMDHVSVPHYSSKATENWGMIAYKQNVLLEDENLHSSTDKIWDVMTITHELAHQWYGNLVSPIWWKYLWLSEGISTYLKYFITDKFLKEKQLMNFIIVYQEELMLEIDSSSSEPIHINITSHLNVREAYSVKTYVKAAFLLRMASHFLSEDVFRNGLLRYLQEHEYSSATPDDLWKALQEALDESDVPHDDFKVKEVMDTWFEQARYPLVTVNRDYATGNIKISQEKFKYQTDNYNDKNDKDDENNEAWWIPLNFATQSNLDFTSTLATHWLKPHDEFVTIEGVDINDWIIVNKHVTGYYRVNYDTNNWKRIAAFLNSENYDKIPVLNRARILDDAFYMMANKRLDLATFIEIINYLSRETDTAPWHRALIILEKLDNYLQLPEGAAIIKPFVSNLMHKLMEKIDFGENLDDDLLTERVKIDLYHYDCMYGLVKCPTEATAKLIAYIEDPIANHVNIPSILRSIIMKSFEEDQINKIKLFAEQHKIDIEKDLQTREEMLVVMKDYLSQFRSILENRQLSSI
ncbi:PREDICTED: puromycin-sensitive aminopeptidase-like protein isoform X2 [Vollenhovia emeryi]|uniref:puromycin-sensitive aminopeptidase-like protein isoform X2 n=1 Tax=Vollenhovia emeryi TaxID=411798 RepID=UPI0005F471C6|nr:PREDICTED: puromycin-sensitive aminopeptidase-like protein isoform X2 [Vollenhovia emeryi]